MRKFPNFELIFSGGEGRLVPTCTTWAELAGVFFTEQGVDMKRVTLESQARTTRENAIRVAALMGERCKQPWLTRNVCVAHAPLYVRVSGNRLQRHSLPSRLSYGKETSWTEYSMAGSLMAWQTALHEYLGMFVYGVTR